ncbi:TetR/AcrR family transcriptional regulator [Hwanghaeella grinnelliae]|uniref:TetR/AcrR family transcriptional regulator n=1 Tax=Hwanghaeella grinnelliae TaxID=2500179 RepID=A0A437QHC6_9PROT|nr:TetR/AcrR family transcriptional regulator [Hwanghaeella grinnelliae]RVU33909.1 TetR/AcrR family transcriptional regulator [Hwanghaeella grinnelliae]
MRPRQFEEDKVLKIAFDQFWRKGVRGTSLSDIAREAQMQRGSLYNAFGSKEELFLSAYRHYTDEYLGMVEEALSHGSLRERLTRFFDVTIKNFRAGTPPRGCPTTRGLMELDSVASEAETNPLREAFSNMLSCLMALIEETFRNAQEQEEFNGDCHLAAGHVLAVARGLVVLASAFGDEEQLRAIAGHTVNAIQAP